MEIVISWQKVSKCVKEVDECGSGRASRAKSRLILEQECGSGWVRTG